jgi:multiple sugar transport system substrate-binding protein
LTLQASRGPTLCGDDGFPASTAATDNKIKTPQEETMRGHRRASAAARMLGAALIASAMSAICLPVHGMAADQPLKGSIRFTWWGATLRNQKTQQIIALFQQANPGVTISAEPGDFNTYWDKLTVQSASSNQPCSITMQSRYLAQYADPSILKPLDAMVKSGELQTDGVDKAVMDSARGPDGKLYFIPSGVFYFTMLVNRTDIETAGMKLPQDDWTWDDFAKFVQELQPKLPKGVHATGNMGNEFDAFTNWVQGRGEVLFRKDGSIGVSKQTIVDYFTFWEKLRKAGDTEPIDQTAEIPNTLIDQTLLAKGELVFDARPSNQLDAHQKVLSTAHPGQELVLHTYPLGPAGQGNDIGSNGFAIGANCNANDTRIAAAWSNFFLENPKAAEIYASDNGVVSVDKYRQEQGNSPQASEGLRELVALFAKVAPTAKSAFFPSGGYKAMLQSLQDSYQSVAFGKASADAAAGNMLAEVKRLMR